MGQGATRDISIEKYIHPPHVTKEDVYQIKICFESLNPNNGVLELSKLSQDLEPLPLYMQDVIDDMKSMNTDINFDDFFHIMRPKLEALKNMPRDSVVMENTTTSVFCVICPYKTRA